MRVMNSLSLANDKENCGGEDSAASLMPLSPPMSAPAGPPPPPPPPPAPPPPPPPGLPPPPPPPPPALGNPTHGLRKKKRVRSFFWKTIPEEKVKGKANIWTLSVRQQQYQIDVRTVEELFGQQDEIRSAPPTGRRGSLSRGGSFKDSKEEISILDSKRGMNVGIFLKQFRKSNQSIIEDIRFGNSKQYGSGPLKELLKLLPESEELKKLQAFKGNPSKLTLVDSFMYLLIQVPSFEVRIEAMVLKEEFMPSCSMMSHEIDVIRAATTELMTCEELHAVLHLVLQAGNIMNAGGYAGNAVGFKLSSLLSLADTKANKPGMNLLHFVALEAQKKDQSLLKFPEKLHHVQSAVRISVENIEADFQSLYVRTKSLEEKIQKDSELLLQLDQFLQNATRMLHDLKKRRLDLRKEGSMLIDFFCEDKDAFKLDDCFRIFQDFCLKFQKAVKDNLERELKEAARQRRLKELEEKRGMWSGEKDQGGGGGGGGNGGGGSGSFGRSSSENDVETLTREGLLDFLQQRPLSPHSPLGRSSSSRRQRHTMAAVADRELQSYLELFRSDDPEKFNSLPRSGRPQQRRLAAWLLSQDDNRELDAKEPPSCDKQATSPQTVTEPLSPLSRSSTCFSNNNNNEDPHVNDNELTTVSEGAFIPRMGHNKNVFQKTLGTKVGQMNVNVERHTLVPGLQQFDLLSPVSNNNNDKHFVNHGDLVVTDLERVRDPPKTLILDTPPSSKRSGKGQDSRTEWDYKMSSLQKEEEEDNSTVSSTTCDTPLPLDTPVSNRKPVYYILDCTETDCSVTLDYSEIDSSPVRKEGVRFDSKTLDNKGQATRKGQGSLSSNAESATGNELSAPKPSSDVPVSVTPTADTEEAASDTTDDKPAEEEASQVKGPKIAQAKAKGALRGPTARLITAARSIRPRSSTDSQNVRKVVPLTKVSRSASLGKRVERPPGHESADSRRPLRDQSAPTRRGERHVRSFRRASLPAEETKAQRGTPYSGISRWTRDQTPRKPSLRKPSAKPVRNVPKPPPEEKMCRSTLRALAQAQAQAQAASEGTAPQSPSPCILPSFARNTVASSSRTKKDLAPADSTPATPSKSTTLGRTGSLRHGAGRATGADTQQAARAEEKPHGPLRRVSSVRGSGNSAQRSDTPPPSRDRSRKSNSFSEKSIQSKDSSSSKTLKPSWK
ncbi:FH2 domain-containing protein 1-like [Megalops cyprinoides]|uniref:FH2 domain-containing protein 1-like n=1 Tax=Megalops cyprinoides TaxID=118141 RepID=UPI001863A9DF|nr:FH2 domain-containing protein 1-like [Megalops cyprinoides]